MWIIAELTDWVRRIFANQFARAAVSLCLVGLLFTIVDISETAQVVARANSWLIALGLFLVLSDLMLSASRFWGMAIQRGAGFGHGFHRIDKRDAEARLGRRAGWRMGSRFAPANGDLRSCAALAGPVRKDHEPAPSADPAANFARAAGMWAIS